MPSSEAPPPRPTDPRRTPTAEPPRGTSRLPAWTSLLAWFFGSRLVLAALGVIGIATFPDLRAGTVADRATALSLQAVWHKWDAVWYERIAVHGYGWEADDIRGQATAGFFPVYPVLIGLLLRVFPPEWFFWVASVCSNVLAVGALALLTTRLADSPAQARRVFVVFATAAGSFYLSIPYAESLALLLVVAVMVLTRARTYTSAFALCGLAAATRPQGIALLAVPLLACWQDDRLPRARRVGLVAAGLVLTALPLAVHALHLQAVQGEGGAFISRQAMWDNPSPYPLAAIAGLLLFPWRLSGWLHGAYWFLYAGLLARWWRRLRPGEALYCAGVLLISTQQDSFHGIYRYVVPLVPMAFALADEDARFRWTIAAVNLVFGTVMLLAFVTSNRLAV